MELAVIKTGGKQYLVSPGASLVVEKLPADDKAVFDQVLLTVDKNGKAVVGQPRVANAKVEAALEKTDRGRKILVIKFKSKVRYRVKRGHRQPYSRLKIGGVSVPVEKSKAK